MPERNGQADPSMTRQSAALKENSSPGQTGPELLLRVSCGSIGSGAIVAAVAS